jgi:hypothetical protein
MNRMYRLSIINKGIILSRKELTDNECRQISGFGAQWLMNAVKKHFNLDIGDYTLSEYQNRDGEFILIIREEDLIKLRGDKLDKLLAD